MYFIEVESLVYDLKEVSTKGKFPKHSKMSLLGKFLQKETTVKSAPPGNFHEVQGIKEA